MQTVGETRVGEVSSERENQSVAKPVLDASGHRPFHPDKAASPVERLVKYLHGRPVGEKLAAVVALRLQDDDLQAKLQQSGVYDGLIGDDLAEAWERDIEGAKLDAEQTHANEMSLLLEDLTR
jgi:hypothetical protein